MKVCTIFAIFSILLLMILLFLPNYVHAESGFDTIPEGNSVCHPIEFRSGSSINISYSIKVEEGINIDVFFVDLINYQYYRAGKPFKYYVEMTELNVAQASHNFSFKKFSTYYLILDNTAIGTEPPWDDVNDWVRVNYTIEYELVEKSKPKNKSNSICMMVPVITSILLLCFCVNWGKRKNVMRC